MMYDDSVIFGSTRKHRYSSVPPVGGAGLYAAARPTASNRSPARSGAGGGGGLPWMCAGPAASGSDGDDAGFDGEHASVARAVVATTATANTCRKASLIRLE